MPDRDLTPLERCLRRFGIRPVRFAAEMRRVARRLGLRPLSRKHLLRLRLGRSDATSQRILLIVATLRELTGVALRAGDVFALEPAGAGPFRGGTRRLSLFSTPGKTWPRRRTLEQRGAQPSAAETLEVLYREHAPLLRSTARHRYNIPPADVDELVNDIFASFLDRQPRVNDARAFLLGAINNACRHYWRKRRFEAPLLPEHESTADPAEAERHERWTRNLILGATMARIGSRCRDALRRYYLNEERPDSIARRLSITPGYVQQILHACRKRAREIYRELTRPRS